MPQVLSQDAVERGYRRRSRRLTEDGVSQPCSCAKGTDSSSGNLMICTSLAGEVVASWDAIVKMLPIGVQSIC